MDDSEELTQVTGKAGEQRLLISQGEAEAVLGGHHHQWGEGWKASIAVLYAVLTFRKALVSGGRLVLSESQVVSESVCLQWRSEALWVGLSCECYGI